MTQGAVNKESTMGTSDAGTDECVKTGNYLKHLSGQDREISLLILEHNYSKPWTWRPETSFAKPTRTLFTVTKSQGSRLSIGPDDEINVEIVEQVPSSQLPCVPEADDCERYAEELRSTPGKTLPKDDLEDWETRVPRAGWTAEHLRLYSTVVKALHELQLARLALVGRHDEAVQRRLLVDTAARRVRRAMASVTWDLRLTHWLHATLQEHMPTPLLAIYLEVLQTLRAKVPSLVDQMLTLSTYNRLGVPVSEELLQLLQKPWDPAATSISSHKPIKLPMDPIIVTVPSGIGHHIGHNSRRSRYWVSQLSLLGRVAPVSTSAANLNGQSTIENMLDQLLTLTRARIEEIKSSSPGRPIILFGWHVGAAIACQAALMENVAAVVCMGFPISTIAGRRGQADDALLDLQCPIFFVIGQNASTSRQSDIEELRERLKIQSGLLVVGSADEQLRVTGAKKRSEGLTQAMIDRCILDEVGDFLGSVLTQPTPPPVASPAPSVRPSPVTSVVNAHSDTPSSRRTSLECIDVEPPEPKKSRSSTPLSASMSTNTSSGTKPIFTTKQEVPIIAARPAASKRVYEASRTDKRTSLGSRQGQSGITVNIGSLGSLAPLGPIRLGGGENSVEKPKSRSVKVPSTLTSTTGLTSLSSLLTSSTTKNSLLLSSNPSSQIKVVPGGEDAVQPRVTLLTSGTATSNVVMVRPAAATKVKSLTRPLSPSTILELPVIFAKDGDPDQFSALTAPLPLNIPDDMTASQYKKPRC